VGVLIEDIQTLRCGREKNKMPRKTKNVLFFTTPSGVLTT